MTETHRILHLLGRRIAATMLYRVDDTVEGDGCLSIHLADAQVFVFIEENPVNGQAKIGLSFLAKTGSPHTLQLNQWVRPSGCLSIPDLVSDLWSAFWAHEVENRQLGRVQWMHGPELPFLTEDGHVEPHDVVLAANVVDAPELPAAVPDHDVVEELLSSIVPGPPQKAPIVDILDLFD